MKHTEEVNDTTLRGLERVRERSPNYPGPGEDQLVWWLVGEASRAQHYEHFYGEQYAKMRVELAEAKAELATMKAAASLWELDATKHMMGWSQEPEHVEAKACEEKK